MKKLAVVMTVLSMTMFAVNGHAQPQGGAAQGGSDSSMNFAWGIGVGAVAVLATMAGLVGASSSKKPKTFSHS